VKKALSDFLPSALAAAGLAAAAAVFALETRSFRDAVAGWAARDLDARTALAAATLHEPLATGDFRSIHEFGASCSGDGVRLTVFSAPGGVVFDSSARPPSEDGFIFASHPCGEFTVRLGIPLARVFAPYRRARMGFALAGVVGGAGVLLVALFTVRQRARMRKLAGERDAQRRLVEELKKVEKLRSDFIADVSHEIKTPVTGMTGAVDLLLSGDVPPESRDRLLGMVKSECARINGLAQGILSLARLERAEDVAVFAPADLSEMAEEAAELMRTEAGGRGVAISVHAPERCIAECDAQLVSGALSNLIANAVRHSGSADVIVSVAAESDGMVRLAVEDHGIGIPPEERELVFERFHRVDAARSRDTGGAGLGLAIVRRIARLHGGDAFLEAVEPSGCRFSITVERHRKAR